jgi:CRP-like cAMP-binding protein
VVNHLLESLPPDEAALILPELELVPLVLDAHLFDEGALMTEVYFPVSGLISLVTRLDGVGVESGTIGSEGMLGLPVFLLTGTADSNSVVQLRGEALKLSAVRFLELIRANEGLSQAMMRYTAQTLWMTFRSGACNRVHTLAQRAARWLLLVHDHVPGDDFELTHRYLAQMLGVRRAGVTNALGALQHRGIIQSRRGRITVLNRSLLEAGSCECHTLMLAYPGNESH